MRNLLLTLLIWTICFAAIVLGASMSYKWYRQLGTDVYIHFDNVSGLVPNQSKIMYQGVQVGTINNIEINLETRKPYLIARINKKFMHLLGEESKFWIVSPEFGLGKISNLSAISTGDYVNVFPIPGKPAIEFWGTNDEPVDNELDSGLKIILKGLTAEGIDEGSNVLYHDLIIGKVADMSLAADGRHVLITIFIDRKYARVIRKSTYFGNISGFHADIHLFGGSKITLNSIRTLVQGGIKVETPNFRCPLAKDGEVFKLLNRDELSAREESN